MLLKDMKRELEHYTAIPNKRRNKLMDSKIKIIPSIESFREAMFNIGVNQQNKQYSRLITDNESLDLNMFTKNNSFIISKQNVIFSDDIEASKYTLPKGTTVDVYTMKVREGFHQKSKKTILYVAYFVADKLFFIDPNNSLLDN